MQWGTEQEGEGEPSGGIDCSSWGDWGVWNWGKEAKEELENTVGEEREKGGSKQLRNLWSRQLSDSGLGI